MEGSVIHKIKSENVKKTFHLKPDWALNSFECIIIENTNAWRACVTEEKLEKLADERQKDKDDYYREIKQCISDNKMGTTFDIVDTTSGPQFVIYCKIGSSKIKFFAVNLEKVDYQSTVSNLLDEVNTKNMDLINLLRKSEEEKNEALNDVQVYEAKLQEFVDAKASWEKEMYSNFLLLLNEKKKRISFLTSILQAKKQNAVEVDENVDAKAKGKSKKQVENVSMKETVSSSESDADIEDYETDEDNEDSNTDNDKSDVQPSTSKLSMDLFKPDSPPPVLLPKRVKVNNNLKEVGPIKAAIVEETKQIPPEPDDVREECSPTLNFTTQDLIDRMI